MIDVMMFLLVFFVLVSINVIPALGLKLQLPLSSQVQAVQAPRRITLGVPPQGPLTFDGRPIESLEQLARILRSARQAAPEGLAIIVQGDQDTPMQRLVDVMDVLRQEQVGAMTITAKKR